ncbi:uncharacterized protein LOC113217542 [Frankliniella occidentalis]|uniref:Uncharacterized protein LOC113217542 n=1 Tax=Frankliniella occidentalis TaxID=133901 RepID=A0A6J1TKJ3_FRAOC|nr:uncharacterized protein LOC113217542 [Frankliniella occidentalis]
MTKTAWLGVLLALTTALPGSFSCLEVERDCTLDMHCCQGMTCKKDAGSVYGKCRSGASGSDSEKYVAEFWQHSGPGGNGLVVTANAHNLGQCQGFSGHFEYLNGEVSGLKWSDNVVLVVYDAVNCGGSSLVVYSSGPHKMRKSDGMTEDSAFLAGVVANLETVCLRDRCGYTSTSNSVSYNVDGSVGFNVGFFSAGVGGGRGESWGKDTAWDRCECTRTWNDDIRSFRMFRRNIGTSKDVRRRRREIPRKNLSPAEQ